MARPRREQPRFGLVQRGQVYYIRWWHDSAWHRVSTRTTDRGEAERQLAEFVAGLNTPAAPAAPTVAQILAGYLADRRGRIRTWHAARDCARHVERHLGPLRPEHLTAEVARRYARERMAEGKTVGPADARRREPISPSTVRREVMILRAALTWAVRARWIADAPHVEAPSAAPARERWLTGPEASRLLEACQAHHIKTFVALALFTGARMGAILELQWSQVDFAGRRIGFGGGHGKKRRARSIPINDELLAVLTDARTLASCPYVVEFDGRRVGSIKTGFRAACRRARLAGVTPHALRHTAASWMIQAGVSFEQAAAMLGNSAAMVEKVYGHFAPGWLDAASRALGSAPGLTVPTGPGNVVPLMRRKLKKC